MKQLLRLLLISSLCLVFCSSGYLLADSGREITGLERQHLEKAMEYGQKNQLPEAIAEYQKAIEANPRSEVAYMGIAGIYNLLKEYSKAESYCKKALEIDPNFSEAYVALGGIYIGMEQYEHAIDYCRKALAITPDQAEAYITLSAAYLYLGQFDSAKENAGRAKKLYQASNDNSGVASADGLLNNISTLKQRSGR